ncbi:hypothetical protein FKM82_016436 [Ascaphus truei]
MQREQAALGDQRSSAALACVGLRPEGCLVFMCQDCHTVLGDSLGVCGEDERLGVVACLRVTEDVAVVESMLYAVNGVLKGCVFPVPTTLCTAAPVGSPLVSTSTLRTRCTLLSEACSASSKKMFPAIF